jgi:multisubunit Na+/H+ antiporter MnhC subunit
MVLIVTGLYAVLLKDNILKKVMGLGIFTNGIHLFLVSLGYRTGGAIPIMTDLNFLNFASTAIDPLPSALILTSIVINLSITAVALVISILVYRNFGTLNVKNIKELKG